MHRSKNIKIITLVLLGIIIYPSFNFIKIYATNGNSSIYYNFNNKQSISDINNPSNIGSEIYVEGTITKIDNNYITIKDDSEEGLIFIENILLSELKVNDLIFAKGTIVLKDESNVLLINNSENIGLVDVIEDNTNEEDTNDNNQNDNKDDNTENNTDKPTNSENTTTQQKPNNNSTTNNSGNSIITENTSGILSNPSNEEVPTTKTYSARTTINISSDLSKTQWDSVTSALEKGYIKVKDIGNNKIRITQVYNEYGDKIWIVNDPRMLDDEEETITVGKEMLDTIDFTEYNISEKKWNTYIDDVIAGSAKFKIVEDNTLNIIYCKNSKKDSIVSIEKR